MSSVFDGGDVPTPSSLGCSVIGESTLAEYYRALQVCAAQRIISGHGPGGGDGQVTGGFELRGGDAVEVAWRALGRIASGQVDPSAGCQACGSGIRVEGAAGGGGVIGGFSVGGVARDDDDGDVAGRGASRGARERHDLGNQAPVALRVEGSAESAVVSRAPRGPNYMRNKLDRERKKRARDQRRALGAEVDELQLKVKAEELRRRMFMLEASAGTEHKRAELNAKRLDSLHREAVTKESRHKAGLDHVAEALRLAKDAVAASELVKYKAVAGVAGWAATVSSSGAESVARSSNSGISLKSVSSASSASALAAAKGPLNVVESLLVENSVTTEKVIRSARAKVGRPLGLDDVFRSDAPFRMSSAVKREVALAGAGLPKEDYHEYY